MVEDSLGFFLLSIALVYLIYAAWTLRRTRVYYMPASLAVGLFPLYLWKALGAARRVFVEKAASPGIYDFLHDTGEVLESFSGIILALAVIYISLRLKGAIGSKPA